MPFKIWNSPNYPPDADTTVLLRLDDEELPIWGGWWDGEDWLQSDGSAVGGVLGWMHLDDAAEKLDEAGG
jgi:hypothetical protein